MKLIFTTLVVIASFSAIAQTPITLDRSDFPCPTASQCGIDSVLFTNVSIANNPIDVSQVGANSIWNYTSLNTTNTDFSRFVPSLNTPIAFQLVFFGSDYAIPLLGNLSIATLPISDAYEYYNYASNNTRLEIKGFGANITIPTLGSSFPLPAIYSSPDVLYRFPVAFGNVDSSFSGYSVAIPPTGTTILTVKRDQKRVNVVDAWGNLSTPAGSFDVLRVKSTIDRIDSVLTGFFPLGTATTTNEYKWIAKGKKIPVLQVNSIVTAQNETINLINYWGEGPNSISMPLSANAACIIFPNPATHSTSINFGEQTGLCTLDIISINGSQVGHFEFLISKPNQIEILPLNELPSGNYIIRCQSDNHNSYQKLKID